MIGREDMDLHNAGNGFARDIEGRLHRGTLGVDGSPVQRDTQNKVRIQIDRIQFRRVGEAIKWLLSAIFLLLEEFYDLANLLLLKNATWPPND